MWIHKYLREFRYSYWWRARHVGVIKPLTTICVYNWFKRILRASLGARRFLLRVMRELLASFTEFLTALCVEGKRERVAPRLYAHERNRKLSEIGVSVLKMQHKDVVHVYTELKHVGNG